VQGGTPPSLDHISVDNLTAGRTRKTYSTTANNAEFWAVLELSSKTAKRDRAASCKIATPAGEPFAQVPLAYGHFDQSPFIVSLQLIS
jgi:hypothetical protein